MQKYDTLCHTEIINAKTISGVKSFLKKQMIKIKLISLTQQPIQPLKKIINCMDFKKDIHDFMEGQIQKLQTLNSL